MCKTFGRAWQDRRASLVEIDSRQRSMSRALASCPSMTHACRNTQAVSLKSLIARKQMLQPARCIDLAMNLLALVLQLHETPWLHERMDKTCVQIFPPLGLDHPLISRTFHQPATCTVSGKDNPRTVFLELGILFQEIWHLQTLESWASASGVQLVDGYYARLIAAMRMFDCCGQRLPPWFAEVAEHCIRLCLDKSPGPQPQWRDERLRRSVCERVLVPLQEDWKALQNWMPRSPVVLVKSMVRTSCEGIFPTGRPQTPRRDPRCVRMRSRFLNVWIYRMNFDMHYGVPRKAYLDAETIRSCDALPSLNLAMSRPLLFSCIEQRQR